MHLEETARSVHPVLVLDDEPVVLNFISTVLEHAGFQVLRAASPEEALRIGTLHQNPICLLLADVIMPGQSGPAVAQEFSRLHPETRYLFVAGHPDSPEVVDRIVRRGLAFLAKPFVAKTLLDKVREVLAPADHSMSAGA